MLEQHEHKRGNEQGKRSCIPTVYRARALLKSAVSGTCHRIHTTERNIVALLASRSLQLVTLQWSAIGQQLVNGSP